MIHYLENFCIGLLQNEEISSMYGMCCIGCSHSLIFLELLIVQLGLLGLSLSLEWASTPHPTTRNLDHFQKSQEARLRNRANSHPNPPHLTLSIGVKLKTLNLTYFQSEHFQHESCFRFLAVMSSSRGDGVTQSIRAFFRPLFFLLVFMEFYLVLKSFNGVSIKF